jgi:formamidopyrimidine-DNA glycosylase
LTWPPKFTRLIIYFDNHEVALSDQRRLGFVALREDALTSPPICDLAPDPILDELSFHEFREKVGKRRAAVKVVLMDQHGG